MHDDKLRSLWVSRLASFHEVDCHWLDPGKYHSHLEFQMVVQLFSAILVQPEDVEAPAFQQLLPGWMVMKIFPPPLSLGSVTSA